MKNISKLIYNTENLSLVKLYNMKGYKRVDVMLSLN